MAITEEARKRAPEQPSPAPPYGAYAGIVGAFAGVLGVAAILARRLEREPRYATPLDLAVLSVWAAPGLATTQIVAPRFGRLLPWSLAAAGANDFLQAGFVAFTSKTNELQERSAPGS